MKRRSLISAAAMAIGKPVVAFEALARPPVEIPQSQNAFADIIRVTRLRYIATEDEALRADIIRDRNEQLRRTMGDHLRFENWLMLTMGTGHDKQGNATILLTALVSGSEQYSIANIPTEPGDPRRQAFRPDSPEYGVVGKLNKGAMVVSSGVFFADGDKQLLDAAAVLRRPSPGLFRTPLYPVRFSTLRPV